MPARSNAMIKSCFSAVSSAIKEAVPIASAITPGHADTRAFWAIVLDPLTNLFLDQARRTPGHDGNDNGEGENIFVGAGEGQQHRGDSLQACEQEATQNGPINTAKATDDGRGKANHAKIKADPEIDLIVVEAVHYTGESR